MAALWRNVLSALTDPRASGREEVLALGAAELALHRDLAATADDVGRVAYEEFGVRIDADTAAAALAERRTGCAPPD
ncbi:hypothetical protein [Streptomyces sp. NPDC003327]